LDPFPATWTYDRVQGGAADLLLDRRGGRRAGRSLPRPAASHGAAAPAGSGRAGRRALTRHRAPAAGGRQRAGAVRRRVGGLAAALPPTRDDSLGEDSTSTDTNVARIVDLARQHRWGRILLVTNQYHVPRVRLLAELGHLAADVVSAEAIVDAALSDPKVH